jgi:uncharacterized protein
MGRLPVRRPCGEKPHLPETPARLGDFPNAIYRTPVKPSIVFAHGAGAPSASGWMQAWRRRLETLGPVTAFDYPYMTRKSRRPDPLPTLVAAHRGAIDRALTTEPGPLVLAGKSMGSRVGCHVAAEGDARVRALVCFGYPLKGMSGKLRDQVLIALATPILFVQGTRDNLCPLDLLDATRRQMTAKSELHLVEGGDHSLAVTKTALKKAGETQDDVDDRIFAAVEHFVTDVLARDPSVER